MTLRYYAPQAHDSPAVMCSLLLMANHHPRIAKLAKDLAYRKGEIQTLSTREKALVAELAETKAQLQVAEKAVLELSRKIQDFHLNPDDVRTIRATPRLDGVRHGVFRKELAQLLQQTGEPLGTAEILELLQAENQAGLKLPTKRRDAMHRIARDLRVLRDRGWVIRADGGSAGAKATWLWIGEKPTSQESS